MSTSALHRYRDVGFDVIRNEASYSSILSRNTTDLTHFLRVISIGRNKPPPSLSRLLA